jgi:hypothetical protein
MIVNDDSRVVNKFETLLTDDARVVIYDCHMFIAQATELSIKGTPILNFSNFKFEFKFEKTKIKIINRS